MEIYPEKKNKKDVKSEPGRGLDACERGRHELNRVDVTSKVQWMKLGGIKSSTTSRFRRVHEPMVARREQNGRLHT